MKTRTALLFLLLTACAHDAGSVQPQPQPVIGNRCASRICTLQYDPVCATIEENGRTRHQTFGNSCMVCSDNGRVVRTRKGACAGDR